MNGDLLLDSIGEIDAAFILSAQRRLGLLKEERPRENKSAARHSFKMFVALAAVLIMLFGSFTVAMAVNEDFREAVFTFLGIEQTETVPKHSTGDEDMSVEEGRADIGGVIEGTYVHTPSQSHARNGLFMICTDEEMMNSGNHFDCYKEQNGQLIKLEERFFSGDYTILENDFHVEFGWVDNNGSCDYTYIDAQAEWRKPNLSGDISSTLMCFPCSFADKEGGTSYPVLIDLETGELADVLAGTGAESLTDIANAAISEDLTKMLLATGDGCLYFADLSAKALYSVDELSGEHAEECSLVGNTLACWAQNVSAKDANFGRYRAWTIDLNTLARHEPLSAEKLVFISGFSRASNWGNMYLGSSFALEVDEEHKVYVIDISNGEKTVIEGYLWQNSAEYAASPDENKLLVYTRTEPNYYDSIGVLDFEKKTFTGFSRENSNDVDEHTIYWFDNEQIIIRTEQSEMSCDYYIYRLLG